MTVVELLEALVQPALLSAPPAVPDAVAGVAATAVVYDSRRATPGAVFVGCGPARRRHARSRRRPSPAARCWWSRNRRRRRAPGALGGRARRARWRWRCWRIGTTDIPAAVLRVVGITGTNGKTTTAYLLRVDSRSGRAALRPARHGGLQRRRRGPRGDADHAGSARPAAACCARWWTTAARRR